MRTRTSTEPVEEEDPQGNAAKRVDNNNNSTTSGMTDRQGKFSVGHFLWCDSLKELWQWLNVLLLLLLLLPPLSLYSTSACVWARVYVLL